MPSIVGNMCLESVILADGSVNEYLLEITVEHNFLNLCQCHNDGDGDDDATFLFRSSTLILSRNILFCLTTFKM